MTSTTTKMVMMMITMLMIEVCVTGTGCGRLTLNQPPLMFVPPPWMGLGPGLAGPYFYNYARFSKGWDPKEQAEDARLFGLNPVSPACLLTLVVVVSCPATGKASAGTSRSWTLRPQVRSGQSSMSPHAAGGGFLSCSHQEGKC